MDEAAVHTLQVGSTPSELGRATFYYNGRLHEAVVMPSSGEWSTALYEPCTGEEFPNALFWYYSIKIRALPMGAYLWYGLALSPDQFTPRAVNGGINRMRQVLGEPLVLAYPQQPIDTPPQPQQGPAGVPA